MSEEHLDNIMEGVARAGREAEFAKINRRELAGWRDEQLAAWQAKYPSDSAQFILAQYEWSRRLTVSQIRAARWAAVVGVVAVILGALLTKVLEKF